MNDFLSNPGANLPGHEICVAFYQTSETSESDQ
jgi:hypothetical protein